MVGKDTTFACLSRVSGYSQAWRDSSRHRTTFCFVFTSLPYKLCPFIRKFQCLAHFILVSLYSSIRVQSTVIVSQFTVIEAQPWVQLRPSSQAYLGSTDSHRCELTISRRLLPTQIHCEYCTANMILQWKQFYKL
jgi:hypothetical protein